MYSLHDSIKKLISDHFGDTLYITDKPITKTNYNCTLLNDYSSTDTVVQLLDSHGSPFEVMNNYDLTGKVLLLGSEKIGRTIISHYGDTLTLDSGFGIDIYQNDTVTIEVGIYILIQSIGSGENDILNDYLNLYNRYLFEVGSLSKTEIENIKVELQFLFKDLTYPFIDENNNPTNSRFKRDDRLGFDVYADVENNYIDKGFIRFSYEIIR